MNILDNDDELNYVVFPVHYFQTKPNGLSLDRRFTVIFMRWADKHPSLVAKLPSWPSCDNFLATDPGNDR